MRYGCVLILALLVGGYANAAEPSTRPSTSAALSRKRPVGMSIADAESALGLSGPVRVANYSQPFAAPTRDPHQVDRDHYTYSVPAFYPYWGGYFGYGYGCYSGYTWRGFNYSFGAPASIFYGD